MKWLIIFAGLMVTTAGFAQEPLAAVEQPPEYPGGAGNMMKYLAKEIKMPETPCGEETHLGCQRVYIKFTVDTTGQVIDPQVTTRLGAGCPGFGEEIIKVMKAMPAWKPGMQDGKKVKVYYSIPMYIRFQ